MTDDAILDVRVLPPGNCHGTITSTLGALPEGGALQVVVDHDPRPLSGWLAVNRPGEFSWTYLEAGPETWRVRIARVAGASADPGVVASGAGAEGHAC